jgi:hypothetical protein
MAGTRKETGCVYPPKDFLHTVLSQDRIKAPHMDPIDGTLKLQIFAGTREHPEQLLVLLYWERMKCWTTPEWKHSSWRWWPRCLVSVWHAARGEVNQETDIFKDIRNEQEEWIPGSLANEQKPGEGVLNLASV